MAASVWRPQNPREVLLSGYLNVSTEFIWTGMYLNRNIFEYLASSKWVFLSKKRVLHYVFNFQKQSFADVIHKIGALENFSNFTGKHLSRSLFLIKLQAWRPATLLKRDSDTGVFLWNLRNFYNTFFYRTLLCGCFWVLIDFASSTRLSDSAWRSSQVII